MVNAKLLLTKKDAQSYTCRLMETKEWDNKRSIQESATMFIWECNDKEGNTIIIEGEQHALEWYVEHISVSRNKRRSP